MTAEKKVPVAGKLFLSLVGIAAWFALVLQFCLIAKGNGSNWTKTFDSFFSYFTILSNILVALTATFSVLMSSSSIGKFFRRPTVQTAVAMYIIVVGIIYNLVLRKLWKPEGWQLLADDLLHVIVPLAYTLYWLIVPKGSLQWKNVFWWLIYPLAYVIYSMIRGNIKHVYPYPFLNATELGHAKAYLNIGMLTIAFLVLGLLLIAIDRLWRKKQVR